jgi:plasmid stability protein
MASITIRNLDEHVKRRLRRQAADHGRSLEAEARDILSRASLASKGQKTGLDLILPLLEFSKKYGGAELEIAPRSPAREIPSFAEGLQPFRRRK